MFFLLNDVFLIFFHTQSPAACWWLCCLTWGQMFKEKKKNLKKLTVFWKKKQTLGNKRNSSYVCSTKCRGKLIVDFHFRGEFQSKSSISPIIFRSRKLNTCLKIRVTAASWLCLVNKQEAVSKAEAWKLVQDKRSRKKSRNTKERNCEKDRQKYTYKRYAKQLCWE